VPVHALNSVSSDNECSLDIVIGNSGRCVLAVTVTQVGDNRILSVSLPSPGSSVRVFIGPSPGGAAGEFEIHDANFSFYGMLLRRPNGHYDVVKNSQTQITISDMMVDRQLRVTNMVGQTVACVTCTDEGYDGILHLEARVHPRVEPVLILSCVLAVILLG